MHRREHTLELRLSDYLSVGRALHIDTILSILLIPRNRNRRDNPVMFGPQTSQWSKVRVATPYSSKAADDPTQLQACSHSSGTY